MLIGKKEKKKEKVVTFFDVYGVQGKRYEVLFFLFFCMQWNSG